MRKPGDSSFVNLTLNRLNEVLKDHPNATIKVGKGSIAALESVLNVDFGLSGNGGEAAVSVGEASAPKEVAKPVAARPQFEVESFE